MSKSAISDKKIDKRVDQFGMTADDWARLDAMTDEEIEAAALSDPDCPPISPERLARMRRVSPAKFVRWQLHLSRKAFAEAFAIPLETLVAWERHEAEPSPTELAYLKAIRHAPDAVREAVAQAPEPASV